METMVEAISEEEAATEPRSDAKSGDVRSFWTMVWLAVQNAFNDKAAQFLLIPLAVAYALEFPESSAAGVGKQMPYVLGGLIVAPFVLFSPMAGWLSDRFSKTWVLRGGAVIQVAVLSLLCFALYTQSLGLAVFGFFLLATQSTLLSPAKKGVVKEMMGSERLGFASGVVEIASVLAICAGQIVSGFIYSSRRESGFGIWEAALGPLLILTALAVPAILLAWTIKVYPSPSKRQFKKGIVFEHFGQLKELLGERRLRYSGIGVAAFWFFGGFLNLAAISMGSELTGGGTQFGAEMAWFIAAASGGVIIGGLLGSLACRRHIELGMVPFGGAIMVLGCLLMALTPMASIWMKWWMVLAGIGASLFLVPLNAYLQDICAPEKRGRVLAGLNLLDCLAGALAVLVQFGLTAAGVSLQVQFILLAGCAVIMTSVACRLLPQHLVRFMLLALVRVFYRIKVRGADRFPKEGGVLLTPNHVSYIDSFIISAACPRPVRFLIFDEYFKRGWMVWFLKLFDTVPISKNRAKEAIQVAADNVAAGHVVCIFPEGQLSRTGVMNEIKRGYEMIARKSKSPVVPAYMDGLWGSIFSFERGKFINKRPYRLQYGVTVSFAEPLSAREAKAHVLRDELLKRASESFVDRPMISKASKLIEKPLKAIEELPEFVREMDQELRQLDEGSLQHVVMNALQIADGPAVTRGNTVVIDTREMGSEAEVIALALPRVLKLKVLYVSDATTVSDIRNWRSSYPIKAFIGSEPLWQMCEEAEVEVDRYDIRGGVAYGALPWGVVSGRVVSVSVKHPEANTITNLFQPGHKPGALGRLLPGFIVQGEQGHLTLATELSDETLSLPPEAEFDSEGFYFPLGEHQQVS